MKTKDSSGAVIRFFLVFAIVLFAISISKADYCPPGRPCSTSCGGAVGWTTADGNFNQYGDFMPDPSGGNWYTLSISGRQDVEAIMYLTSNAVYDLKIYDGHDANMNLRNLCSSYGYKGETRYCFGTVSDGGFIKARYGSDWGSYYFQVNCPYIYQSSAYVPTEAKLGDYLDINITVGYSSWRQQNAFFVVDLIKGDGPNCEKLWCGNPSTDTECGIGNCITGSPFPPQKIGGGTTVTSISVPLSEDGTNGEYKVYVTAYHSGDQLTSSPNDVNYSNPYFTKLYAGTVNITGETKDIIIFVPVEENVTPVGFFPVSNVQNSASGNFGSGTVILGASAAAATAVVAGICYVLSKVPINASPEKEIAKSIEKIEKLLALSQLQASNNSSVAESNETNNYYFDNMAGSTGLHIGSEIYYFSNKKLSSLYKAVKPVSEITKKIFTRGIAGLTLYETHDEVLAETGDKDLATGTAIMAAGVSLVSKGWDIIIEGEKLAVCVIPTEEIRNYETLKPFGASLAYGAAYDMLNKSYDLSDASLNNAEISCINAVEVASGTGAVKMVTNLPVAKYLTKTLGCTINGVIENEEPLSYAIPIGYDLLKCSVQNLPKAETKTMKEPKIVTALNTVLEIMRPAGEFLLNAIGLTNNDQAPTNSSSSSSSSGGSSGSSSSSGGSSGSSSSKTTSNSTKTTTVVPKTPLQTTNVSKPNTTSVVTSVASTISTAVKNVVSTATTVVNNVAKVVNTAVTTVTTVAKTAVTTVSNAISSISNTIGSIFGGGKKK